MKTYFWDFRYVSFEIFGFLLRKSDCETIFGYAVCRIVMDSVNC